MKQACLTLDFEPDCGGRCSTLDSLDNTSVITDLFADLQLPLTVFVTSRILDERPEAIEALSPIREIEFGAHSYSHRLDLADTSGEIRMGVSRYRAFFGRNPAGYRAPQGCIGGADLRLLAEQGVLYDSSVFPTWRPGKFNHVLAPNSPYVHGESGLLEIPVTALRPIPVPLGLGYLRLLGHTMTRAALALASLPDTVVVSFHLHDLIRSAHVDRLDGFWRWFYTHRIEEGRSLLVRVVRALAARGYEFRLMTSVAQTLRTATPSHRVDAAAGENEQERLDRPAVPAIDVIQRLQQR